MTRAARAAALCALLLVAAIALRLPDAEFASRRPETGEVTVPRSPTPPVVRAAAANRQDRTRRAHRRRETRAFDGRPLLAVLPLELGGVRITIEGLAADGTTVDLRVSAGPRGQLYARAVYQRALTAFADPGNAYRVRWVR
jgi:hypothetical protein